MLTTHSHPSPNFTIMCCIPILSPCRHGLYMHHITHLYFTTVSPTPQFAVAVVLVTIRCSQFTLIAFLSLYHITAISHFNVEEIFSVRVLSVGSSNNNEESHSFRILPVSRHCARHNSSSGLWKLQFPAQCHCKPFGALLSNSVFCSVISFHSVLKYLGQNS
jgi:hypothetical protein